MFNLIADRFLVTRFKLEDCYEYEVLDTTNGNFTVIGLDNPAAIERAITLLLAREAEQNRLRAIFDTVEFAPIA